MDQLLTNTITILIALIAAIVAIYQVKSNIISGARMTWISNLRELISSYCVLVSSLSVFIEGFIAKLHSDPYISEKMKKAAKDGSDVGEEVNKVLHEYYKTFNDYQKQIHKLQIQISLHLDDSDKKQKILDRLLQAANHYTIAEFDNKENLEKMRITLSGIEKISKEIFHAEQKKAKSFFRI